MAIPLKTELFYFIFSISKSLTGRPFPPPAVAKGAQAPGPIKARQKEIRQECTPLCVCVSVCVCVCVCVCAAGVRMCVNKVGASKGVEYDLPKDDLPRTFSKQRYNIEMGIRKQWKIRFDLKDLFANGKASGILVRAGKQTCSERVNGN